MSEPFAYLYAALAFTGGISLLLTLLVTWMAAR